MLRVLAFFAIAAVSVVGVVACSDDAESDACPIVGSYTMPASPPSITCPDTDAGGTVDVVSTSEDHYRATISGLGACDLTKTAACKVYGACDVANEQANGHVQISWEFTQGGFNGTTYFQTTADQNGCTSAQPVTQIANRR